MLIYFQAIMFYLPRMIWIAMNTKSGMAVTTITDAAIDYQRNTDYLTRYFHTEIHVVFFSLIIVCDNKSSCCCGRCHGLRQTNKSLFPPDNKHSYQIRNW